MNNKVLINSSNINSKELITNKKVTTTTTTTNNKKQQHQQQQTIKLIISIDKSKDNIKQINR